MSLPALAEVEHADWAALQRICATLGLNPKGRSSVVRLRVLDHVRRRVHPELWRPGVPQQAALLTRLGHPDTATRLWESTIHLDAPSPWVGLGDAQLGAGDLTEAAKAFDRAAQMGDAAAHLHRAEALGAAGNYEGAVRACDAFLAARPGDLRALLLKAAFLARGGWATEAATVLRDAFETRPDVRELWDGLGTLLLRAGRPEAAAEAYREAVRSNPDDLEAWVNRGASLLLAGRTKEAVGVLREVLETDPHEAAALNDLGVAYLREGRDKSAAVNLERAAKHLETPMILRNVAAIRGAQPRRSTARPPRRLPTRKGAVRAPRKPARRGKPRRPRAPRKAKGASAKTRRLHPAHGPRTRRSSRRKPRPGRKSGRKSSPRRKLRAHRRTRRGR